MRKRYICPGFCKNEYLAELSVEARLLFACMPMFADREGRMEDRPKKIRAEIFPYDHFDVDQLLDDLYKAGFVDRYETDGIKVVQIVNFAKHQNVHRNEEKSVLPGKEISRSDQGMPGNDRDKPRGNRGNEKENREMSRSTPDIHRTNREMSRPNFNSYSYSNFNSEEKEKIKKEKEPLAACPPPQAGFGPECDPTPADMGEGREMPDPEPPMEDFHSPEPGFAPESSLETKPGPGAESVPALGPDQAPAPKPTVDIQAIYQAYPRHEGSRAALRKIEAAVKTIAREERVPILEAGTRLLDITREYARSPKVQDLRDRLQRTGENFIPMPATWFGQDRWRDGKQAWGYGLPTPTPSNRGQPVYACELDRTHLPVEEFL